MWFTDNGRDDWGNDRPPDELNHKTADMQHFGFPYCYGKDMWDPDFNTKHNCDGYIGAAFELQPHTAAIGMRFYTGNMFPEKYTKPGRVFIAEHGSWDRDTPIGYRITTVNINDPSSYEVFIDGWLQQSAVPGDSPNAWGRPTDVLVMPDGSLLIADDKANAIYRVSYTSPGETSESGKLKGWEIALIVIGSVVLVGGIAAAIVIFVKRRRDHHYESIKGQ